VTSDNAAPPREANAEFGKGLARAFAGAVLFGLPLLMTMEMWSLAFSARPDRVVLLLALFFPFLVGLSWHAGFEPTFSWRDDVVDALVAYAVGFAASFVVLALLGVLQRDMPLREIVANLCLQAVPASIGALLAQSLLGQREAEQESRGGVNAYASELFIMAVGALFLAFNLAPTEEMVLIAIDISPWNAVLLMVLSLAIMHAFVYSVNFRGRRHDPRQASSVNLFVRFTAMGYLLALLLSAWLLWSFGRLDGLSALNMLKAAMVLGLPASIGAAAARLIL
jgi:putative integral membrane protein (TIGR02587 family)